MLSPPTRHIPAEIVFAIVHTYRSDRDLVFLWTVLRNVNHFFRDVVDEWVLQRHLHTMAILPNTLLVNVTQHNFWNDYSCPFLRISASDRSRAIFSICPDLDEGLVQQRRHFVARAFQSALTAYPIQSQTIESQDGTWKTTVPKDQHTRPAALVRLRRLANDTELVDLTVNQESLELSLDWRRTIDKLIYEEKLRGVLAKKWMARAKAMRIEAQKSTKTPQLAIMQIALKTGCARDESTSNARTKRIQRQKREFYCNIPQEGLITWKPTREDVPGFESVEMLVQEINSYGFSDDE